MDYYVSCSRRDLCLLTTPGEGNNRNGISPTRIDHLPAGEEDRTSAARSQEMGRTLVGLGH